MLETVKNMIDECKRDYSHLFEKLIADMELNPQPLRKKFTNCRILEVLTEIMKHNTKHYRSDFEYDKADFIDAAYSPNESETNFLWLSRPCGTQCSTERAAYVKDTSAYNSWVFYAEQTNDPIVAYAVEVKGVESGHIVGDLYELDYKEHCKQLKEKALPAHQLQLVYRHSTKTMPYEKSYGTKVNYNDLLRTVILPADLQKWDETVKAAQNERHNTHYEEWDLFYLKESYEKDKSEIEM